MVQTWKDSSEVLTIINPSEIKWKGIPFVHSIVNHRLDQDDLLKMEFFWKFFEKNWMRNPSFIITWNVFGHYKDA